MNKVYSQYYDLFPEQTKCFQHNKAKEVVKDLIKTKKNGKVAIQFLKRVVEKEQAVTDPKLKKLVEKTIEKLSSKKLHENKDKFKKVKQLFKQKKEAVQAKQALPVQLPQHVPQPRKVQLPQPVPPPQVPRQVQPVDVPQAPIIELSPEEMRGILKDNALANLSPFFKNVLQDLRACREPIGEHGYREAKKTIQGLVILSTIGSELEKATDKGFQQIIYDVLGIISHVQDDPESKKTFLANVAGTIESLQTMYAKNLTYNEKLRFFTDLSHGVCFEDRTRRIDNHHSLPNLLAYELNEYKKTHPYLPRPVEMNAFIGWLRSHRFFERHRIREQALLKSTAIRNLIANYELVNRQAPELPPIANKLREALVSEVTIMNKGVDAFKKFVLENVDLSKDERNNIDRYIQLYIIEERQYADLIKVR